MTGSRTPGRLRSEAGFTLIEVVVAASLLVVGVLGTLTLLDGANRATQRTKAREAGINLAREAIEAVRAVPYPDLLPSTIDGELKAQPGLADASAAGGWQVIRRGIVYTLIPSVCSVDDGSVAADGYGDHAGGSFCSDSTTTGTKDTNPDDYKRVKIDVTWKDKTLGTRTARQEAVINNPGSAFAPAVKGLTASPVSPITTSATTSIAFTATTSSKAQRLTWGLDNVEQGTGTASSSAGTTWTFSWNISGVSDGTYLVNAQGFDTYGESGAGRTLTIQLNRYAPAAVNGLVGGPNLHFSNTDDFEWSPNPERDIVGYKLYRMAPAAVAPSSSDTVVCTTSTDDAASTACTYSNPPSGAYRYYVVALAPARGATGLEEGTRPALAGTLTLPTNAQPTAPATVSVSTSSNGNVLTWTASSDSDGTIRYYRIYRDDNSIAGRVDRTASGTDLTWTDALGGSGHTYYVTAVDNQMGESDLAPSGGITSP